MESEETLKRAFAMALVESPGEAFRVAFALFPTDTAAAINAAANWPTDDTVISMQSAAIRDPELAGILPSKHQAAREILERARKCEDDEIFGKLMKLYCELMGQIEKPSNATNLTVTAVSKVIMMPATVGKELWSQQATTQQRALTVEGERISADR